jgi:hypothetical protein
MSLSVKQQAQYSGAGNKTDASNLGTLTGAYSNLAGGPQFAASSGTADNKYGWSAYGNFYGSVTNTYNQASAAAAIIISSSLYIGGPGVTDGTHPIRINSVIANGGSGDPANSPCLMPSGNFGVQMASGITFNGQAAYAPDYSIVDSGVAFPLCKWFELRIAYQCPDGTQTYTGGYFIMQYRIHGTTTWINICSGFSYQLHGTLDVVQPGLNATPGTIGNVRIGGFTLATCSAYNASDAWLPLSATNVTATYALNDAPQGLYPNGLTPAAGTVSLDWYLDLVNGSDTNSGNDPSRAWKTAANANSVTMFVTNIPWVNSADGSAFANLGTLTKEQTNTLYKEGKLIAAGDRLSVLSNGFTDQPLVTTLNIVTNGLTIKSDSSNTILSLFKKLPPSTWTLVSGKTYTYSTTDSGTIAAASGFSCVLWEDRKALNHDGTGFANYAAATAYLEATAGSFYVDTTASPPVLYLHPFGSTSPITNGCTYERSTLLGNGPVGIDGSVANFLIKNITVTGTSIINNGNVQLGGYGFGATGVVSNGLMVYDTCFADYYDKHGLGNVLGAGSTNNVMLMINCTGQRGSAWVGVGAQWAFVDYTSAGSGNRSLYDTCSCGFGNTQQVGSSVPIVNTLQSFHGSHGASGGWSEIGFLNCDGSKAGGIDTPVDGSTAITWTGGIHNAATPAYGIFSQAKIIQSRTSNNLPTQCNDCIMIAQAPWSAANQWLNSAQLNRCTIDLTPLGTNSTFIETAGIANITLAVSQCTILSLAGTTLVSNVGASSVITSSNNEFQGTGSVQSHLGTGSDTGSSVTASPAVDSLTYKRTSQSGVVHNSGPANDFTAILWATRKTAGAYEFYSTLGALANASGEYTTDSVWSSSDRQLVFSTLTRVSKDVFYNVLKNMSVKSNSADATTINSILNLTTATLGGGSDGPTWSQADRLNVLNMLQNINRTTFITCLSEAGFVQKAQDVVDLSAVIG